MTMTDCTGTSLIPELDPLTVEGASETDWVCLPQDLYGSGGFILDVSGGTWQSEDSFTIVGPCYTGVNGRPIVVDEACPGGVLFADGGAPYHFTECPSPSPTPCVGSQYKVSMSDSAGDGWSGNELRLLDCDGGVLAEGLTVPPGESEATAVVCTDGDGQIEVEVGGGTWQNEVSWLVTDLSTGAVVLDGGAPADVSTCRSCASRGGQNLTVWVYKARVPGMDQIQWYNPKSDPYAEVQVAGKTLFTKVIDDNNHPVWDAHLEFGCVVRAEEVSKHRTMHITVRDYDTYSEDDLLVYHPVANWAEPSDDNGFWEENELRKFNDTSFAWEKDHYSYYYQDDDDNDLHKGANSEYWVEVAYSWSGEGAPVPEPTPAPSPQPTKEPTGSGGGGGGGGGGSDDNKNNDDKSNDDKNNHDTDDNDNTIHKDDDWTSRHDDSGDDEIEKDKKKAETAGVAVGASLGAIGAVVGILVCCFGWAKMRGHDRPNAEFFSEVKCLPRTLS